MSAAAKIGFLLEAALWLATTVNAYRVIRCGEVTRHREWMVRSFALAAFFVTFSVWDPLLAATPLSPGVAFAAAVTAAWLLNLALAEAWIRLCEPLGGRDVSLDQVRS